MSSKISLILRGSSFRVVQTLVGIVIGVIMMPFLITTLGKEMYGLWIVIGSIVGTYYSLDLGFNQAVTRYVSKYIHQDNPEAANKIINTALVIYSILGVVVFLASIVAAKLGAERLMHNTNNLSLAQTILIISGLTIALEFPAKAFPGIISAYMRYDTIAMVRLCRSIIDALLIYYFISHGFGLVAISLISLCTNIISTSIYVKFAGSLFKNLKFTFADVDFTTLKDVFHFSKWVFVTDMSTMFREKIDIWFIAFYIGSGSLTVYYVAVRLVDYALQFLTQATGITGPIFTEFYAKKESVKLARSVLFFIKIDIALGLLMLVGFYLLGNSFINIWMKGSISAESAFICLMILSLGRFSVYFASPINSLLMTLNKHHIASGISIIETCASAFLCWWLIPKFNLVGAASAIAIPNLIGRLIVMPLFATRFIDLALRELALRIFLFAVVTAAAAYGVSVMLPILRHLNLIQLILAVPVIIFLQVFISMILCSKEDFKEIKMFANRKWGLFSS